MTFCLKFQDRWYSLSELHELSSPWRNWAMLAVEPVLVVDVGRDFQSILRLWGALFSGKIVCPISQSGTEVEREAIYEALIHLGRVVALPQSANNSNAVPIYEPAEVVVFTSGTSGAPKGIIHRWKNIVAACEAFQSVHRLKPSDVWLHTLPLHHISGLSVFFRAYLLGHRVSFAESGNSELIAHHLINEEISGLSVVPTQLKGLLAKKISTSGCRVLIGGAPLFRDLLERAEQNGFSVFESYGATETCAQIMNNGVLHSGVELNFTEDGELLIKGSMIAEYQVTAKGISTNLDKDGFWHSGDLGLLGPDGKIEIVGRKKDLINSGGVKISPIEIEGAILMHPMVLDAAVFGISDEAWGERVCAVVVSDPALSESNLRGFLRDRISSVKQPKEIRFVDAIPRGKLGKVNRSLLADQFFLRLQ